MDAQTCIRTKRDSRDYAEAPISEETLQGILQAGRMSGSLEAFRFRQLPVVREGRLAGLVTRRDIVRAIADKT